MQLVQADVELPHDMRHDVHDQVRIQRSKDALKQPLEDGDRSDRVRDERCAVVRVSGSSGRGVALLMGWLFAWWSCGFG